MTINQALDQLLTKYAGQDLNQFPDLLSLKNNLVEMKGLWGGNAKLENESEVKQIIGKGKSK